MHFFTTHLLFHNLRNVLAEFETPELDLNNPYSCNSEPHSPRKSRSFPHRGGATGLRACTEQHCLYPHTTLLLSDSASLGHSHCIAIPDSRP